MGQTRLPTLNPTLWYNYNCSLADVQSFILGARYDGAHYKSARHTN